jgi:hypothetical protein
VCAHVYVSLRACAHASARSSATVLEVLRDPLTFACRMLHAPCGMLHLRRAELQLLPDLLVEYSPAYLVFATLLNERLCKVWPPQPAGGTLTLRPYLHRDGHKQTNAPRNKQTRPDGPRPLAADRVVGR